VYFDAYTCDQKVISSTPVGPDILAQLNEFQESVILRLIDTTKGVELDGQTGGFALKCPAISQDNIRAINIGSSIYYPLVIGQAYFLYKAGLCVWAYGEAKQEVVPDSKVGTFIAIVPIVLTCKPLLG
jgi:hypothetical protein